MRLQDKVGIVVGAGQTPGETIGNGRAAAVLFALQPQIARLTGVGKPHAPPTGAKMFGIILFLVIFLVPHGARQVAMVAQHLLGRLKKR